MQVRYQAALRPGPICATARTVVASYSKPTVLSMGVFSNQINLSTSKTQSPCDIETNSRTMQGTTEESRELESASDTGELHQLETNAPR